MDAGQIAETGAILILAGYNGIQYIKTRSDKRKFAAAGMSLNPQRCLEHRDAINELKADVKLIKEKLDIV